MEEQPFEICTSDSAATENIIKKEPVEMYSDPVKTEIIIKNEHKIEINSADLNLDSVATNEQLVERFALDSASETIVHENLHVETYSSDSVNVNECNMKKRSTKDLKLEDIMNDDVFSESDNDKNNTEDVDMTKMKMEDIDIEPNNIDVERDLLLEEKMNENCDDEFSEGCSDENNTEYIDMTEIKMEDVGIKPDINMEKSLLNCKSGISMKVSEIKNLEFSRLSLNEKLKIKHDGRPTPELNIVQEEPQYKNKNAFKRKFDKNIYSKTLWICGCEEKNSFFCFVCLLFGGDDNWSKSGVNDLKHLSMKIKKHENSAKHRNNLVSFQLLGKTNITTCMSSAYGDEIRKHNETVTKNRQVLSKIIDILKLCGTCNIALRGLEEDKDPSDRGVFLELVDFLAKADGAFNSHIQEATVFKGTSKTIQNEILQCMFEVCRERILKEIQESTYLALMADDITDVSTQTQTVIILRYELNGELFERFWGFANPKSQDADGLSQCILEQISPILMDCPEKLICQTYDGAAVMHGQLGGVNVKIREQYKNAHFVYCYTHQLNKILVQAVSSITSVRIFFENLNGISTFFSQPRDRMAAFQRVSDKRIPTAQARWNFHSRIIQCVYNNKEPLIECFENIISGIPKQYNSETVTQAAGFIKWLEDDSFLYWLMFFSKVMPHVDILFSQLQKPETGVTKVQKCVDDFDKQIAQIRNNLPPITNEAVNKEVPKKRRRLNQENVNMSAREVCDIITSEVRNRFSFKNHLCGANLFLKENYGEYKKILPLEDINQFCEAYPMIDKEILKMELTVFYSREEITGPIETSENSSENESFSGCLQTLNFITSFGLDTIFGEIVKVLKILVTIPMETSEKERCFPTLKLIKTYLRNTMGEDRLTSHAMLSIEKSLVQEIPNFNEKVIEKFISDKNRRMDFHFKK